MGSWDETKASCSAPQEGFAVQGHIIWYVCILIGYKLIIWLFFHAGYNIASSEIDDGTAGPTLSTNATSVGNQPVVTGSAGTTSKNRSSYTQKDDFIEKDTVTKDDYTDDMGDEDALPTIGISSRGRIVRSKFNVRKHLANSKK